MKSAITLAQVPEAKAGPFVFHQALPDSFATAASLGFDAVELFLPGPQFVDRAVVQVGAIGRQEEDPGIFYLTICSAFLLL